MTRSIQSVAVIGAGTMGAGIAAASAAAGCRVLILDMNIETAEAALQQVDEDARHLVTAGTVDADLAAVSGYDWVCEAIVEDLDVKRELFEKLEELRKDGSVISSNTSAIGILLLVPFCKRFTFCRYFSSSAGFASNVHVSLRSCLSMR